MENEIGFLEKRIKEDKKAIQELEYKKSNEEFSARIRGIYESLLDKGFNEEQAFWIVGQAVKATFGVTD